MALIATYSPFAKLNSFNDWLEEDLSRFMQARPDHSHRSWSPAVDIIENENAFIIKAELPEVDEKAVEMTVEKSLLTLRGERKMEKKEEGSDFRRVERHYGNFQRTFHLPDSVDTDRITAAMKQGVLRITLPKKEETKPRNIKVETK